MKPRFISQGRAWTNPAPPSHDWQRIRQFGPIEPMPQPRRGIIARIFGGER